VTNENRPTLLVRLTASWSDWAYQPLGAVADWAARARKRLRSWA
jgi:hypothetical protein